MTKGKMDAHLYLVNYFIIRVVMRIYKSIGIIIVFFFLFNAPQAFGKIYIDIDAPTFQQIPIAITDFKALEKDRGLIDLAGWFSESLAGCLKMTGFFNVLNKKAFLGDPSQDGITAESIRFTDWVTIGAEYLVKGGYLCDGANLLTEFRFFDTIKGELIVGMKYEGKIEGRKDMVFKFADEIIYALTGEKGIFDTKIAFVLKNGRTSDIYTINFDGSRLTHVTDYASITLAPCWSPDGQAIAFVSYKDGNPNIYIENLASQAVKKIAGYKGLNLPGSWSADGRKLLITLSKDGNEEIYAMDVEYSDLKRLTNNFAIDVSPVWSPDGHKIAFVSNRSGSPQIYVMDEDGNNVRRLTYEGGYNTSPSWSPKGDVIVYEGRVNGDFQIFSIDASGNNLRQLTFDEGQSESPCWSPDGRYLVYSWATGAKSRICVMDANGRNVRVLYEDKASCMSPSWSPHSR
jgi:TolB protein